MEHSSKIQEIASRVRELREVSELSAETVAERLGISLETYLSYESAEADFPVSVLYELAALLRVDLTELLTGVPPRLANCSLVRRGEGIAVDRYRIYKW